MGLEPQLQGTLYEQYWRPMEVDFGQEAYPTHFDGFMRHYLTVKTGDIPNVNQVYEAFKFTPVRQKSLALKILWLTFGLLLAITVQWRLAQRKTLS